MVVQLRRMAFLNKIYSPGGVDFCPLSLKVAWGPPFFISFLVFTYIELQVYKLLPKSECRFYLGGMDLNQFTSTSNPMMTTFSPPNLKLSDRGAILKVGGRGAD